MRLRERFNIKPITDLPPDLSAPLEVSTARAPATFRLLASGFVAGSAMTAVLLGGYFMDAMSLKQAWMKQGGLILIAPDGTEFPSCLVKGARGTNLGGGQFSSCPEGGERH